MTTSEANPDQPPHELIPVTLITGFLGSGKTTLLSRLIRRPEFADIAVIVNEFGEVGLDHHMVEAIDGEMVLLNSGCLCCTVRSDLGNALRGLYLKRVRGQVPLFKRVVVETTGLADPAPIVHTLIEDPLLEAYFRLDGVVTTIDAVNGDTQLDAQFEAVKQAAFADRLVLTKLDLAVEPAAARLRTRLKRLNPAAPVLRADHGEIDPTALFDVGLYNPRTKTIDVQGWLRAEAYATPAPDGHVHGHDHDHDHHHDHDHGQAHVEARLDVNRHDARIAATCLVFDQPLDWERLTRWLSALIAERGDDLLRVKGILNIAGEDRPIAVHGVQHLFHPPARLPAWPDADRRSKLVFITRDIDRAFLEASYRDHMSGTPAQASAGPAGLKTAGAGD